MDFNKNSLKIDAAAVTERLCNTIRQQIRGQLHKTGAVIGGRGTGGVATAVGASGAGSGLTGAASCGIGLGAGGAGFARGVTVRWGGSTGTGGSSTTGRGGTMSSLMTVTGTTGDTSRRSRPNCRAHKARPCKATTLMVITIVRLGLDVARAEVMRGAEL